MLPYRYTRYTPTKDLSDKLRYYGGPGQEGRRTAWLLARYYFSSPVCSIFPLLAHCIVQNNCAAGSAHLSLLIFFSGNPGLLDFYVPFLNAIHHHAIISSGLEPSSSSRRGRFAAPSRDGGLVIFAHAHLGLSSYVGINCDDDRGQRSYPDTASVALPAQIEAHTEFLDELLTAYDDPVATRVLLIGHSVGCWLIQEVIKARRTALGSRNVGVFMLFPTISHIARTPNGKKLSVRRIFRLPFITLP
jgi:Lipid-droplet associated hydrolase